jgi:hypothetical protein
MHTRLVYGSEVRLEEEKDVVGLGSMHARITICPSPFSIQEGGGS